MSYCKAHCLDFNENYFNLRTIVALYALRVEYGHCKIRVDTASGKSWAVDLLNYGMLLGSPAAQQLRNCPAACIHGVAPRSMQVNVKQR